MNRSAVLTSVAVALNVVLAAIAVLAHDWMWVVIDLFCLLMLVLPHVKGWGFRYSTVIVAMTFAAPLVAFVVQLVDLVHPLESEVFWEVNLYTYFTAGIEGYQCFVIGFMLALVMDRRYGLRMTGTWMVIFAMTFAMSVSVLDMFFTFGTLYMEGYPVFNEDFYDADRYTNAILMSTPVATAIVSAVVAVLSWRRLRRVGVDSCTVPKEEAS